MSRWPANLNRLLWVVMTLSALPQVAHAQVEPQYAERVRGEIFYASPAAAPRLRTLLDDPFFVWVPGYWQSVGVWPSRAFAYAPRWACKFYSVRYLAREGLRQCSGADDTKQARPSGLPGEDLRLRADYRPFHPIWLLVLPAGIVPFLFSARTRRMLRAIGPSGCSILLLMICVGAWLRSHWLADELVFSIERARYELVSYRGGVQCLISPKWPKHVPCQIGSCPIRADAPWSLNLEPLYGSVPQSMMDTYLPLGTQPWDWQALARMPRHYLGFAYDRVIATGSPPYTFLQAPYWSLMLVFFILPARRVARYGQRLLWRQRGLCFRCGYDLRATPNRCPECGWARVTKLG